MSFGADLEFTGTTLTCKSDFDVNWEAERYYIGAQIGFRRQLKVGAKRIGEIIEFRRQSGGRAILHWSANRISTSIRGRRETVLA